MLGSLSRSYIYPARDRATSANTFLQCKTQTYQRMRANTDAYVRAHARVNSASPSRLVRCIKGGFAYGVSRRYRLTCYRRCNCKGNNSTDEAVRREAREIRVRAFKHRSRITTCALGRAKSIIISLR